MRNTLIILAVVVAGCSSQARQDATTNGQRVDRSPAEVVAMPDRFRNIADKCDGHGHRIYVTSRGESNSAPQMAVIDDAACPGGSGR